MLVFEGRSSIKRSHLLNENLAQGMGYEYCVLFPCARAAMQAYPGVIQLPENICPEVYHTLEVKKLHPINQQTGLADIPVHLYGYQARNDKDDEIAIDPLMTGWLRPLKARSAIISFGRKKLLSLNYGGAFLTNDSNLVQHMNLFAKWNPSYSHSLMVKIEYLEDEIERRFRLIDTWDRYLGNSLDRVQKEQIVPWRVMRLADNWTRRDEIVEALRAEYLPVGTNFQPIIGSNIWGSTVLNFFCDPVDIKVEQIERTCELIERANKW